LATKSWTIGKNGIHCAICAEPLGKDTIDELRPTGLDGKIERWTYCRPCWEWCKENPINTDLLLEAFRRIPVKQEAVGHV